MKVSVLMSAYCGSKFISEQLDSIVNQTRIPDEVLVINDCSDDHGKTESIIDEYVHNYAFIRKFNNRCNIGWAASFMNGIHLVVGDIVFFADQDDVWRNDKIEQMLAVFQNEDVNGVISDCINVDSFLNPLESHVNSGKLLADKYPFNSHFIYPKGVGAAMAVKKEFLDKYYRFWDQTIGHDRFYQVMLVLFDRLYFLDMPLVNHRMHGNNATGHRTFVRRERIEGIDGNIRLIKHLLLDEVSEKFSDAQVKTINQYLRFANKRKIMLNSKSIIKWFVMPVYGLNFYPTKKTWFGDLKCIVYGGIKWGVVC